MSRRGIQFLVVAWLSGAEAGRAAHPSLRTIRGEIASDCCREVGVRLLDWRLGRAGRARGGCCGVAGAQRMVEDHHLGGAGTLLEQELLHVRIVLHLTLHIFRREVLHAMLESHQLEAVWRKGWSRLALPSIFPSILELPIAQYSSRGASLKPL